MWVLCVRPRIGEYGAWVEDRWWCATAFLSNWFNKSIFRVISTSPPWHLLDGFIPHSFSTFGNSLRDWETRLLLCCKSNSVITDAVLRTWVPASSVWCLELLQTTYDDDDVLIRVFLAATTEPNELLLFHIVAYIMCVCALAYSAARTC